MNVVVYDGSFEAFLTGVFDIYEYRLRNAVFIRTKDYQKNVFGSEHMVVTDRAKAERVWKGLRQRVSAKALAGIHRAFLSEIYQIEDIIFQYIQYAFSSVTGIEYNYSNSSVLAVSNTAAKVAREKHRMEAFVRFQLTKDELYYATIQPDYNVLPLISEHFEKRYADQKWMIYDIRRQYGIYYNRETTEMVEMTFNEETDQGRNIGVAIDEEETLYQQLWQQYFNSVNIAARKNMKLHIKHMPKRYWKFLIEKKPFRQ
jgi:probable DNA metabolism protein